MIRAARQLTKPVSESHLAMALVVAAVAMAMMLWGIIWQSNIITYQRALIRSLLNGHFGG
jgi:hypothetical protein